MSMSLGMTWSLGRNGRASNTLKKSALNPQDFIRVSGLNDKNGGQKSEISGQRLFSDFWVLISDL
jgi:hypothetical protein